MNKYIITDNRGYESYFKLCETICVTERIDTGKQELLKTTKKDNDGAFLWVRGDMCVKETLFSESAVERVICIPDSGGHTLDLQRVQYISPLENGGYKVTLVSGWDLPLTDEVYSRQTLIEKWKALQNKSL